MSDKEKNAKSQKSDKSEDIAPISEELKKYKQLEAIIRHKKLVIDACEILGKRLIERGNGDEFNGRKLIANSYLHDHSKFSGVEWKSLIPDDDNEKLKESLHQHVDTNEHHPECWGGINNMPKIYIAEMVCDWFARSTEFGTDLRAWIKDKAVPKYDMSPQGKAYKTIKDFVDLLLEQQFKKI